MVKIPRFGLGSVIILIMAFFFFIASLPFWLYNLRPNPLQYKNNPFPILNKGPIKPGQELIFHVSKCNTTGGMLTYKATRRLVNLDTNTQYDMQEIPASTDPGCYESDNHLNIIPKDGSIPPGRYVLKGNVLIETGFGTYVIPYSTQEFHISDG